MTLIFLKRHGVLVAGVTLLLVGSYLGLAVAPPERHMGDVQRIMYVHVPTAWSAMLSFTLAFGAAIASLWTGHRRWDALLTGATETGVVLNALLLVQGMIWARATWGVWWDWDVRLTTSLVMLLLFAGVLTLRPMVEDADRRATWSATTAIVAYVDVPLVYFCVRWWRSLHQIQSSRDTLDPAMLRPLGLNSAAILLIALWLISRRSSLELKRRQVESVPEPPRLPSMEGLHHA